MRALARLLRMLGRLLLVLLVVLALLALALKWRYGGGAPFPDRGTAPLLQSSQLEIVAALPEPPGNLAVDTPERIFFSFHPEARPAVNLALWEKGDWRAWPGAEWQPGGTAEHALHEVLSLRLDRERRRLWVLDTGFHGLRRPRLLAFDADSGALQQQFAFPREIAGLGSHYNDFQISPDGQWLYIADASFFALDPALVVYDVAQRRAWRAIAAHESVAADRYLPEVGGRRMEAFGLVAIRPGVDSIALSPDGQWLYYAPVSDNYLWRVRSRWLRDTGLTPAARAARAERFALKTMSDGILADGAGGIWLTDPEHFAIQHLDAQGRLRTLLRDERLRWPDGLSQGPRGDLYITASGLHQIIGRPPSAVAAGAPWHILRLRDPQPAALSQ